MGRRRRRYGSIVQRRSNLSLSPSALPADDTATSTHLRRLSVTEYRSPGVSERSVLLPLFLSATGAEELHRGWRGV